MFQLSPDGIRFIAAATAASTAETCTLPIDCIKVRLQTQGMLGGLQYSGMFHAMENIVQKEGTLALWKGFVPAIGRQVFYSSMAMMLYDPFRAYFAPGETSTFGQKIMAGGCAGAVSIALANPLDVVKVRLQADRAGRNGTRVYRHVFHAFQTIMAKEGVRGLFKGVGPNVQRGFIVNAAELGVYDQSKESLTTAGITGTAAHLGGSCIAGLSGAIASNPMDVIKTRLMAQPSGKEAYYCGIIDCFFKTVQKEGPLALYQGFLPNWMRKGPFCILFFMTYEQSKALLE